MRRLAALATSLCTAVSLSAQAVTIVHDPVEDPELSAAHISQKAYNRAMSKAHQHVAVERWQDAESTLVQILETNTDALAAQELLGYVKTRSERDKRVNAGQTLQRLTDNERWQDVVEFAASLDVIQDEHRELVQNARHLAQIETQLDRFIARPDQLARPVIQQDVDRLEAQVQNTHLGSRVDQKYRQFTVLNEQWTQLVELTIHSDQQTTVTIRPGQSLGTFRTKRLQVRPGHYELIGRRGGYREVRTTVSLMPDAEPLAVTVRAAEKF